jgi:hypothetical protein
VYCVVFDEWSSMREGEHELPLYDLTLFQSCFLYRPYAFVTLLRIPTTVIYFIMNLLHTRV